MHSSLKFVKFYSQEMATEVIDAHINLYVNEFSISLGEEGKKSVRKLFSMSLNNNTIEDLKIFL